MNLAYLPSPTRNVWNLGPIPIRAYAICIIIGVVVAVVIGDRRWRARGGSRGFVADMAVWAVPFGLVGARLYHVATDPELYFDPGRHPLDAFKIWDGGLGIWGAIFLGAIGVWIGVRRRGARFGAFADAVAPGIAIAQAIGRVGNWFNNELYGGATTRPWGLTIHDIDPTTHRSTGVIGHFQPTFLYELIWDLGTAAVVVWADRRFRLGHGRAFSVYVMVYVAGRAWIEYLRTDPANHFLGVRLNVWTCAVVFLIALAYFLWQRGGREDWVERPRHGSAAAAEEAPTEALGHHDAATDTRKASATETADTRPIASAPLRAGPRDGEDSENDSGHEGSASAWRPSSDAS